VAKPGCEARVGRESGRWKFPPPVRSRRTASVAESRWESGSEAPRSQMYTDSLQLSNAFLRRFVAQFASLSSIHLPQLTSSPKKLRICANPVAQQSQAGWARATCAHPWLRYCYSIPGKTGACLYALSRSTPPSRGLPLTLASSSAFKHFCKCFILHVTTVLQ